MKEELLRLAEEWVEAAKGAAELKATGASYLADDATLNVIKKKNAFRTALDAVGDVASAVAAAGAAEGDGYTYKTYRCEWTVECGEVDQYGMNFKAYRTDAFPTREEAEAFLPTVAKQHEHVKGRWVPLDAPHSYAEAHVSYRQVEALSRALSEKDAEVASAVAAERERCARIAAGYGVTHPTIGAAIAAAIRSPAPAQARAERMSRIIERVSARIYMRQVAVLETALSNLMAAHERRIRSDCKNAEELAKQPWRCAEYIAAEQAIAAVQEPSAGPDIAAAHPQGGKE